jgi:hypothetical protein
MTAASFPSQYCEVKWVEELIAGGDNEVQRTMLEIVNQLDGFDSRGNIKVRLSAFQECFCPYLPHHLKKPPQHISLRACATAGTW